MNPDDEFYIRDTTVSGELVLWWRAERRGYTNNLSEAGVYTKKDALAIEDIRGTDIAYPKATIDALAIRVVRSDRPLLPPREP